jgi:hypothetical protein
MFVMVISGLFVGFARFVHNCAGQRMAIPLGFSTLLLSCTQGGEHKPWSWGGVW